MHTVVGIHDTVLFVLCNLENASRDAALNSQLDDGSLLVSIVR